MNSLKVGLALGGGVARGIAHIGVLTILESAQIPINMVAGASAGAVIGVGYCAGLSIDRLYDLASGLRWWRISRLVWPKRGLISFQPLADWLRKEIGDLQFHQLRIPFAVSCVNLLNGKPQILSEGPVIPAVQASCSVPGLVTPVESGGMLLADGNFGDAVPIKALHKLGATYSIGVDVMQPALRRKLGFIGYGITGLEILLQRMGDGLELADCLIQPGLAGDSYVNLSRIDQFVRLGMKAAEAKLPELKAALSSSSNKPSGFSNKRLQSC